MLTPLGEPLSTIAVTKLQGEPYNAGFFFLFNRLAVYIIPGILAMGILSIFFSGKKAVETCMKVAEERETLKDVVMRAAMVYIFVMALLLLGGGMKIVIDKYLLTVPPQILYWVNMISAILDNATLTAAELSPAMEITQIQAVLMGLPLRRGLSPRAHGSGLFTRGETQVLTLATLGTLKESQEIDSLMPLDTKRYMHHYDFPPFSTGEVKSLRGLLSA